MGKDPYVVAYKLAYGNRVAQEVLTRLSNKWAYGSELLVAIEQLGLYGPRIEHLYNAVKRDDKRFVCFIAIMSKKCSREEIIYKRRDLADFLDLVSKLRPLYEEKTGDTNW